MDMSLEKPKGNVLNKQLNCIEGGMIYLIELHLITLGSIWPVILIMLILIVKLMVIKDHIVYSKDVCIIQACQA